MNAFLKKKFSPQLLLILLIIPTFISLIRPGFYPMQDDLQAFRVEQMVKCLNDFQIPCRWIPDMGYGYGFPLFNFYPPLPYLIGEIFRVFGFSFVNVIKIVFALSIIASGVGMYFLAKEFFGKVGGVVSAIFYIWAPYHAVDVYVRGAMNESWALVFFPLIFLFSYKIIHRPRSRFATPRRWPDGLLRGESVALALSYAGLLMSHNLMVLIFTPVFVAWCGLWLWRLRPKNLAFVITHPTLLWNLALSGIAALGLSAFFTIPALAENYFTWVKSQLTGYYDYTAHFVSLKQLLISRFWGYGPSVWIDAEDGMSFQIGHVHWILSLVIGGWWLVTSLRKKKSFLHHTSYIIPFLFLVGWAAAFMTHVRSTPIYQAIPFLNLVQFPWRFLTIIIFVFSFLAGSLVLFLQKLSTKYYVLITAIIAIGLIALGWSYFLPDGGKMGPLSDKEKFSVAAWDLQQTAGIYDYLPSTAREAPKAPQSVLAEIMQGEGTISEMKQGTNWAIFKLNIKNEKAKIRINILKFPGWRVWVDGKKTEIQIPEEERWGRMWINISQGKHNVSLKLYNTPIRTTSNIISAVTWLLLLKFSIRKKWLK